jgi:ribonuclease VapC
MVVDSSMLVAIVLRESRAIEFLTKLTEAASLKISAVTLVEASMVLLDRGGEIRLAMLDALLAELRVALVPVDRAQALLDREAFRRYGKGRHEARLNLGDCFTYALAKNAGEPLLFQGKDFVHTDLLLA